MNDYLNNYVTRPAKQGQWVQTTSNHILKGHIRVAELNLYNL